MTLGRTAAVGAVDQTDRAWIAKTEAAITNTATTSTALARERWCSGAFATWSCPRPSSDAWGIVIRS
jgi:hypothetical protein